ncbi:MULTISPECIES: caspase family protein [Streptomyces]|uniref:Caspase family protein n=1 Tax=Streptomyces koelreuteriae TaxID=2838015 RepID=A0ABX8FXE6_9ACTN|nr:MULTISPECIES: caspase family protein [Streptomyces]QWB25743.1 caspase family protein [Streptomyces koelreuteriae]UUA08802.1 caspase family protein [Streptomyces koelreuteriae]UUA16407.1 caspase family protein [Streptomyces sp. CRCS-T-1]
MTDSRHALIIANDRYDDQGLKKLKAPAQDAAALERVLHDPQIGDFEVEVVHNASADLMRRRIQGFFNERDRADTLLLHFSCHGLKSESGELYLAASDTEPPLLAATAVPSQFVRGCMYGTRAGRTVLFLDCCYGGAFSRGSTSVRSSGEINALESFAKGEPATGRGWAVITASDSMEYAFEGSQLAENSAPRPSLFTHAVVEGLQTGEADLDADGNVSLDDLYEYVYRQVQEQNPHQTPKKAAELRGELHLAHSRRGRIKIVAVPSPPSLQAAMNSEEFLTRQGAVTELRKRLRRKELPMAEGARQHLEEVARNDIQPIAELASEALSEIHLAPSPRHLDFGRAPQGSPPRKQPVTLYGPPLARHCVAQPQQTWLRVDPTPTGLEVHVDTTTAGHRSGAIVLKGVADEAVIHVEAVVDPVSERNARPPSNGSTAPTRQSHAKRETVTTEPARIPSRPKKPPERTTHQPSPSHRAPTLAGAALALAATSVITLVLALQAAVAAVMARGDAGPTGNVEDDIRDHGALTPLIVCLITGAMALVTGAFARHELGARQEHYTSKATSGTRTLTAVAKGLAIPTLTLAVLAGITYLVGSGHW